MNPQKQGQNSTPNPYSGFALTPGKQYAPQQLWGQNSREMVPPNAQSMDEALAKTIESRNNFIFPHAKPSEDTPLVFQPMGNSFPGAGEDPYFTPFPSNAPSNTGPTADALLGFQKKKPETDLLRYLLQEMRRSASLLNDQINALEAAINQTV